MSNIVKQSPILRVAVPSPLYNLFDYLLPKKIVSEHILPGIRVVVPFGNRELVGVVLEITTNSKYNTRLKRVIAILDDIPILPSKILDLIRWTSDYYHHPIGDVVSHVLPKLMRQMNHKRSVAKLHTCIKKYSKNIIVAPILKLNNHQQQAFNAIRKHLNKFKTFLLDGITGSGKTEIYFHLITEVIALNKQALVLIPEINLTPQTITRFTERFQEKIAVLHSRLTLKERLISWQLAKNGIASIIIGTRSAMFVILKNPGIIIVDEEHDLSFKQQARLRYSARDLAVVRGKLENIPVVLGSATPSFESVLNVNRKRYIGLTLPERAGGAIHPSFHLVDMRNQKLRGGIAENLLFQMKKHLNCGGQILVFLNRRGFAPILICRHCGWVAECKYCDARLTIHQINNLLCCHHCGNIVLIPAKCPKCCKGKLLKLGYGTERVTAVLQKIFPEISLVRIDSDTIKRKNSLEIVLNDIYTEKHKILIGTQMITKGHHFPKVSMVAILDIDHGLFSSDFRASEHLAQLIIQVAGRAGRASLPGEVYLQTHHPNHQLLLNLISGGYASFVSSCLVERQAAELPPYTYLALFQVESKNGKLVFEYLNLLKTTANIKLDNMIRIFGPVATIMKRKAGYFRAQLLLQSNNRDKLHQALNVFLQLILDTSRSLRNLRWFLDVDPVEFD
ncbi:MAG: primosomal protein N' [Coxiellaceae bacterium]|jgi:primosomal protein N' (replication factor Y)|nr:primosomal protein N' [Coxiellaceae bacterium]